MSSSSSASCKLTSSTRHGLPARSIDSLRALAALRCPPPASKNSRSTFFIGPGGATSFTGGALHREVLAPGLALVHTFHASEKSVGRLAAVEDTLREVVLRIFEHHFGAGLAQER